ncbi:Soluble lytic murein transglycosylase and related regulatory protein (some contain LysM/invasin domains) [marine gamma proteobacterium HTCC2143]|jgi:soluble lytic murein transglycosylase-like protein|uniref:Soluble lytic murein transglycosylase and related regulatory protein (Some contain LysM/invasin domains) n=1 Tax=marine gamma proteobacterium HTCC2143 TaxID=247633 RepID=A0YDR2_9GAMM|nr:Soluble lytic murein transglycosylase and related regulatory protein (some contain LysM/invasin domains) [marine gamma proteobacterium HTCC2143]
MISTRLITCILIWVSLPFSLAVTAQTAVSVPKKIADSQTELRKFLKSTITKADSFEDRFDAEVWLVDMSGRLTPFIKDPRQRLELLRAVHREASKADLKPDLVLALIEIESRFDNYAISSAGAQGLMQVMPFWKKEIGRPDDNLTDINTNLSYGCRILQFYLQKEKGNWMHALARYNGSYGKYWYPERVMDAWRKRWFVNET